MIYRKLGLTGVKEIGDRSDSTSFLIFKVYIVIQIICLPSCSTQPRIPEITISELRTNLKYQDKEVKLTGVVSKSIDIPFMSTEFYKITDGTSEIWVVTESGSPPTRANVEIQGFLKDVGTEFETFGISAKIFVQKKMKLLK